jgi:mono/diheme cytochrome c family protein
VTKSGRRRWRAGGIVASVGLGVAGWLWVRSARGFSADAKPTAIEAWLAGLARDLALPRGTGQARDPVAPTAANLARARAAFKTNCEICHNGNGDGQTAIGRNLYPPPPDLRGSGTQHKSDGALFYSIRNGIRMSGMPAWPQMTEQDIWGMVTLIRHMPGENSAAPRR